MIGGLMYLTASRPDIAFATFVCARYQARPTVKHLKEVKRIFRYLRQSYNMGLWYPKDFGFELIAYSDADHARCKDDYKSTSGGLQFLGGKLMSWSSKKQDCTAMSTAEAEYVSLSTCCAQVIWMRTQLLDYGYKYNRILMYRDSKSTIAISCNPVQHSETKHIDIRYHFIKEHVEKGTVEIYFVGTEYQLADLFTKALPKERFEYLVHRIGMRCMTPTQLESLTKFHNRLKSTHNPRTTCAPRSPNPNKEVAESSALRRSTVIHLRLPERRSICLTPLAPVSTVDKADEMILQDTLQVSLAEHKSRDEHEARENVILVDEHLASKEIEKMIAKEKEVEITQEKEVEITNVIIPVNVTDEDEEITDEVYELKRKEKGNYYKDVMVTCLDIYGRDSCQEKARMHQVSEQVRNQVPVYVVEGLILERKKAKEEMERLIAKAIFAEQMEYFKLKSRPPQKTKKKKIENAIANVIPSQVDASVLNYMSGHILHVHPAQSQTSSIPEQ
ncbi:hypothetical protein Tco_1245746 [Tanacetum coccineum]